MGPSWRHTLSARRGERDCRGLSRSPFATAAELERVHAQPLCRDGQEGREHLSGAVQRKEPTQFLGCVADPRRQRRAGSRGDDAIDV